MNEESDIETNHTENSETGGSVVFESAQEREDRRSRSLFSDETFINAADLRQSPAGDKIYNAINNTRISHAAKEALMGAASVFNGTDLLLSNLSKSSSPNSMYQSNDNYGMRIKLQLRLLIAKTAMTKFDMTNSAIFNIKTDIENLAFLLVTRTTGDKRERLINSILRREDEVTQRIGTFNPQPITQPSKKFWQRG